jgi:urea carboxylase
VSESELLKLRRDFITGHFKLRVEETTFSLRQYNAFLQQNAASITAFKGNQQAAFEAERERWKSEGKAEYISEIVLEEADTQSELDLPDGARAISAHVTGTVWKLLVQKGDRVKEGDTVLVVESMKMEFSVAAPVAGTVSQLFCKEGAHVSAGQMLLMIHEE